VNYFITTVDQLEGVKRLEVNYDEKYSGDKDAHFDHRPLVLIITQQWQPPLFSKRQSNTYHVSNMTLLKQQSLARVYNITSVSGQAQMYLMHLMYKHSQSVTTMHHTICKRSVWK
jgi:hypothetical protein